MVGVWVSGLLLCVTIVAFSVIVLVQYVEVRDRSQGYGILRVLGASPQDFLTLLAVESLLIAVPGTVCGIVLASAAKVIVWLTFSRYLTLSVSYRAWPATLLFSFAAFTLGGLIAAPKAVRDGVEEALSYHK
jgi:ABC-type antimicrobial peptide transport system permease subunit